MASWAANGSVVTTVPVGASSAAAMVAATDACVGGRMTGAGVVAVKPGSVGMIAVVLPLAEVNLVSLMVK